MGSSFRPGAGSRALRLIAAFLVLGAVISPANAAASEPTDTLEPVFDFNSLIILNQGDTGDAVARLQDELQSHGFFRGEITGDFDTATATAVITLHKYLGVERTGDFSALDWIRLTLLPKPEIPYRWDEPDRVEIDTTRQLLFVIRDRQIAGILPTSTGSGASYFSVRQGHNVRSGTPHGDFTLNWRQYGWNCDRTTGWCVYNYWGFTRFYGIHGYNNVPAYPASHGCSRVHIWDSDWLDDFLFIGMPVHVWRERPDDIHRPPQPVPPPI